MGEIAFSNGIGCSYTPSAPRRHPSRSADAASDSSTCSTKGASGGPLNWSTLARNSSSTGVGGTHAPRTSVSERDADELLNTAE